MKMKKQFRGFFLLSSESRTNMKKKVKWYNDVQMVGTLLLFWPPLGIYGVYKSEAIEPKWKTITYGTFALAGILLAVYFFS